MDYKWILSNKIIHRRRFYRMRNAITEKEVRKVARRIKGNIFIDIGSNKKMYPKLLKNNFNRIITIDPNPKWDADLQVAVSNFNGESVFRIGDNEDGGGDSIKENPYLVNKTWYNTPAFKVKTITFDSLELNADLVKIDVEGAEIDVIDGMNKYLPKNVIIEVHDNSNLKELIEKMNDKGYKEKPIDFYSDKASHWWFRLE